MSQRFQTCFENEGRVTGDICDVMFYIWAQLIETIEHQLLCCLGECRL